MIKKSKVQTHLHTLKELRNQNSNTVHVIQLTEISWASYLWVIWQKETQKVTQNYPNNSSAETKQQSTKETKKQTTKRSKKTLPILKNQIQTVQLKDPRPQPTTGLCSCWKIPCFVCLAILLTEVFWDRKIIPKCEVQHNEKRN